MTPGAPSPTTCSCRGSPSARSQDSASAVRSSPSRYRAALQAPFLLWPTVGVHGLDAIAEPVGRLPDAPVPGGSTWWPVFDRTYGLSLVKALAVLNIAMAAAVAW